MHTSLHKAIKFLGGPSKAGKALKLSASTVSYWLHDSKQGAPAEYCRAIEQATGGKITAAQLRPDVFADQVRL